VGTTRLTAGYRSLVWGMLLLWSCSLWSQGLIPPEDVDRLRAAARQQLQEMQYYDFVADFVSMNVNSDIGSSHYEISGAGDSTMDKFQIPFTIDIDMGGDWKPFAAFNIGLFKSVSHVENLQDAFEFDVVIPETNLVSQWQGISLFVGGGVSIPISEHWSFKPTIGFAWSYFENESEYSGPGAESLYRILNGLATDWEVDTYTSVTTLQVDYERDFDGLKLHLIEKIGWYYTRFDHHDQYLNDFTVEDALFTSRLDVENLFGLDVFDWELGWTTFVAHHRLDLGDSESTGAVKYYNEVGGYFMTVMDKKILGVTRLRFGASYVFGPNIRGASFGLGFDF
jgi:hypothetical protein